MKHLVDNGIDIPWFMKEDEIGRQESFDKYKEEYGFDPRECWSLDSAFMYWLYPRLIGYKEQAINKIDLEYHKFEVDGEIYTELECIDNMINLLEKLLKNKFETWQQENKANKSFMAFFSTCWNALWW